MSGSLTLLLRNLRLKSEGKPNTIDAMEDLKAKLINARKRHAERGHEAEPSDLHKPYVEGQGA